MENQKKIRNSNIEILRIIAMFFIVAGHFISQSGNMEYSFCINDYILVFLGSASRIAVNIFLIIGVWYMINSKFSADRILKLYIQVVTYSLPITALMLFLNRENVSVKDFARGFLPFLGRGLWFASAYITLMLFKPFLDKILTWEKRQLGIFVVLQLIFISFVSTLPDVQEGYVIDSVWFLTVYLLIGYIKKYPPKFNLPNWMNICFPGGVYILMTVCIFMGKCFPDGNIILRAAVRLAGQYAGDIKTLPNFIIAFFITMWVLHLKEHQILFINNLSKSTFSVYIVHQVPAFISFIWSRIFMAELWITNHVFWYVFIVFIFLYAMVIIADTGRRKFVEPLIEKSKLYQSLSVFIENIYDPNKAVKE